MVVAQQITQVPFVDLGRLHAEVAEDLQAAFERVVARGSFSLGEEVDAFEREFAGFVGVADAVGVSTGTDALHLALRALDIGAGDEVITAVNTFAATAEAILMSGARPVFVDIDPATYLMDLDAVEAAITSATAAIIPVHLYGQCVDMARLGAIARKYDLRIVEDACQAHGARRDGVAAGAGSSAGCFSFYPSKNLGALGDGGAVTTNDTAIAARIRSLRNHGEDQRRLHVESGYCARLHGLQAAFLRAKLPRLARWNDRRAQAASTYRDALLASSVILPAVADGARHVYHLYVVRAQERDLVRTRLAERGIQTGIHYAVPLHLEPAFEFLGYLAGQFPHAEKAAAEIVSLPMFPHITGSEVERVAEAIAEVARG